MKKILLVGMVLVASLVVVLTVHKLRSEGAVEIESNMEETGEESEQVGEASDLQIEGLRKKTYPGSQMILETKLSSGSGYERYLASYESEGLKINGLLTIPTGKMPEGGFPAIVFNHGYIAPSVYKTQEKYVAYVDSLARSGYVVFKIDYRGHDKSEGEPTGAYGSAGYLVDSLNAVGSLKQFLKVNPQKIGMWGHSMGGHITLKAMVVSGEVKAGVIWAGVVASYTDLLSNWSRSRTTPPPGIPTGARRWRQVLTEKYGSPEINPTFWNSISANSFLKDLSGPIQLHHGEEDTSVPAEFSRDLFTEIKAVGKETELYLYPGDNHNISKNFSQAMGKTIEFFDKYLKTNNDGDRRVVAAGLDTPWSIAFLKNGDFLITERRGVVKLVKVTGEIKEIGRMGRVQEVGEGGLLGMALHPNFDLNQWIYFYYTYAADKGDTKNRVVRMKY
ncbi:hypothetical protein A2368_01830, partial [Candidatus Collierbacteria bacterium RIFOXYB1_FULL_49_13]